MGLRTLVTHFGDVETGRVKRVMARFTHLVVDAGSLSGADRRIGSVRSREIARSPYDEQPLLVFWEMTRACDFSCEHCRVGSQPDLADNDLTAVEGRQLVDELAAMSHPRPILILTGGDCLKRDDVIEIVTYASLRHVTVAVAATVTSKLTDATLHALRQRGVKTISVSLDGANATTHDFIRGVPGNFEHTLRVVSTLKRCGFTVQITTTVMALNVEELADMAAMVRDIEVDIWEVFFLVDTAASGDVLATTPQENEDIANFLYDASRYGFTVRTAEAPFFRRVVVQRQASTDSGTPHSSTSSLYARLHDRLMALLGEATSPARTTNAATRDAKGIIFVAANGDVLASGFMRLSVGNIRHQRLSDIYRESSLLQEMRSAHFHGVCGSCAFAQLCGGSRARAFVETGDPLGSDPACVLVSSP